MCRSTPTTAVSALACVLIACGTTSSTPQAKPKYAHRPLTLGRTTAQVTTSKPACARVADLDQLAQRVAQRARRDPAALKALAKEIGVTDTRLHLWSSAHANAAGASDWLRRLSARSDAPLVCGTNQSSASVVWVAAERAATLAVDADERQVTGTLSSGFQHPVLVVLGQHATLHRQAISLSELRDGVSLPSELGKLGIVQLMATGKSGAYPVAEVWVNPDIKPTTLAGGVHLPIPQRVDALRQAFKRGTLRHNRLLSKEAHSHAVQVCRSGRAVHEVSVGLDPVVRAQRLHIQAEAFGEAVARAKNLSSAFETLLQSPAHLLALSDPRFTDVGMASASAASGYRCLVVLLAAWPRIR